MVRAFVPLGLAMKLKISVERKVRVGRRVYLAKSEQGSKVSKSPLKFDPGPREVQVHLERLHQEKTNLSVIRSDSLRKLGQRG